MSVTVSLMSRKNGEIKRFLDNYFQHDGKVDDNVIEWIYVYKDPDKALDIINIVMDQYAHYALSLWVKIDDEDVMEVTKRSRDVITTEILEFAKNKSL